jgi:hypothetical protein
VWWHPKLHGKLISGRLESQYKPGKKTPKNKKLGMVACAYHLSIKGSLKEED